jgi:hypothetical protein
MKGETKNFLHLFEDNYSFCMCFIQISTSLLVSACDSLLNDMFGVFQACWVIAVEFVFKKFP